ncbi:MAG: hypothetical protein ABRQ23_07190 [Syntrophomonadaceae bacterium]
MSGSDAQTGDFHDGGCIEAVESSQIEPVKKGCPEINALNLPYFIDNPVNYWSETSSSDNIFHHELHL